MALGFDFGSVSPAVPETVTVVTRLTASSPSGVPLGSPLPPRGELRILSRVPFEGTLRLEMVLASGGRFSLDVFNLAGRRVRTLDRGDMPAGRRLVSWDGRLESGRNAPSGVYFIKLHTEAGSLMKRVVLLR
jgi:hypothetical protein